MRQRFKEHAGHLGLPVKSYNVEEFKSWLRR